jgi:hypothetical protein
VFSQEQLLRLAEAFAARIPRTREYALDWNGAWRAIVAARLRVDDIESAQHALNNIDEICMQARLRVDAGLWAGQHRGSAIGREMLRDTVARASTFEPWWSRRDVTDLAGVIPVVLGVEYVEALARQLDDRFTAANVYVTLAGALDDPATKREQLRKAEALAVSVSEGNRDFAIRRVFGGYRDAGLIEDAERLRHLAKMDPGDLTREERTMLAQAESAIAQADTIVGRDAADTLNDRLRRFMDYRFNDLKVIFLTDVAGVGELDDADIEARIGSDAFQRLNPPRAPRLRRDIADLDADGLARHLFDRPVCQHRDDRALLEGDDECNEEYAKGVLVRTVTQLFEDFGRLASPFRPEQVEQGVWFVLGEPFWLHDALANSNIALESRERCVRAMICPFRDYDLPREAPLSEDAFFMWWDLALMRVGDQASEIDAVAIDVLDQILQLPAKRCQFAALHGLNHLHPHEVAGRLVREYLQAHRASLTADEIAWIEACASGEAL